MNKKVAWIISFVLVFLTAAAVYMSNEDFAGAQEEKKIDRDTAGKMLRELRREKELLTAERQKLEQTRRNLENFEAELNKRYDEYIRKTKELEQQKEDFNKKIEGRLVDRQTIETYESIDPEQAAILMKNLYNKDKDLATLVMRKIAGKKAGKILEAMIPLDAEISTRLAKDSLDFYKPK